MAAQPAAVPNSAMTPQREPGPSERNRNPRKRIPRASMAAKASPPERACVAGTGCQPRYSPCATTSIINVQNPPTMGRYRKALTNTAANPHVTIHCRSSMIQGVSGDIFFECCRPTGGGTNIRQSPEKAASKAVSDGAKSMLRTNSQASAAPCSRSMPMSSHSTDRGPL